MSLRGRKFFDVLKHHPSSLLNASRFRLPCPPYHNADYWDRVYKDMTVDADSVVEWGGFDMHDLLQFRHETILHYSDGVDKLLIQSHQEEKNRELHTSTFAECMGISQLPTPEEAILKYTEQTSNNHRGETILILGCGNSKVGEQLLVNSFVGPILQIDISSKVIHLMAQRYEKYMSETSVKRMELIVDDATRLTAISPDRVGGGVIDKGLIDALHCSLGIISSTQNSVEKDDEAINPIHQIVDSVHRVLQPSRPFIFFSRSEPEYILRRTLGTDILNANDKIRKKWKDVQVLKMADLGILLYRFVKAETSPDDSDKKKKKKRARL